MRLKQSALDGGAAWPVILGAGLTGAAISRSLSTAGIRHILVGERPTDLPRLGESLNAEGSLEIARQFPEQRPFLFDKRRQALFFGGHSLCTDFIRLSDTRSYEGLIGYPSDVPLLHVDRVGLDRAVFDSVTAEDRCLYVEDRAAGLEVRPGTDRIEAVLLAKGQRLTASYVFDATNQVRFLARRLGVPGQLIGEGRRVAFAHYRAADAIQGGVPPPWMDATSLLRLEARTDRLEGLAWCIPLGDYVSVGVSVDPRQVTAPAALLLDSVERAYALRGLDVRGAFASRGVPVDLRYSHYTHERCYGSNWLLTGPSCCQTWFPSAGGVGSGLVAARIAAALLRAPPEVSVLYQAYMDQVAAAHWMLDWLVRDDPWSVTAADLQQRGQALVRGNVRRLSRYLSLPGSSPGPISGDALVGLFEEDRRLANPQRVDTAAPEAQAARLFAPSDAPDPWTDAPIAVSVLTRPAGLEGPAAILGLVDVLSGRRPVDTSAELVTPDVRLAIDGFSLQGLDQWVAWACFLRASPRVQGLELVPGSLKLANDQWDLICQWQGIKDRLASISPEVSIAFRMAGDKVAEISSRRADYSFVAGDGILPPVAFAALLGQVTAVSWAAS